MYYFFSSMAVKYEGILVIKHNLLGEMIMFNFYNNIYNFVIWLQNTCALLQGKVWFSMKKIMHFTIFSDYRIFSVF